MRVSIVESRGIYEVSRDVVFVVLLKGEGDVPVGMAMATAARAKTVMMENCILNDVDTCDFFPFRQKGELEKEKRLN
jgi:hypothetical protein